MLIAGIVTGWGATQEHGAISDKLLEVQVPIMANSECRRTGYGNKITANMMCAGYKEGMKDSCQVRGDVFFLFFKLIIVINIIRATAEDRCTF